MFENTIWNGEFSMTNDEYYKMLDLSLKRVQEVSMITKRFLYDKIDWRDRLISISGSRGTGKTTLILQHIKDEFKTSKEKALYVSLDNLWFETHSLSELIEMHYMNGGTHSTDSKPVGWFSDRD